MARLSPSRLHRTLHVVLALLCFAAIAAPAWAQFESRAMQALPNESFGIAAGDFNHDGKLDVAIIGDYLSVLLGNGDGTFQPPVNYTALGQTIAVADFNGDGNLDLVIGNENNSVSVFLGKGDGTFQLPKLSSTTGACCSFIAVADFNGDHKMDIVVIDHPYISVLLGNGDGTFQAPIDIDNDLLAGAHELTVGDFNNDHRPDVALVGYFGGTQNFWILLGNGDGTFQAPLTYPINVLPGSVAAADFNRDGNLDLAVGEYIGGDVAVLLGNGDGSFQPEVDYGTGPGPVLVRDFNGDGNLDIVTGDNLLLGNGDGTFHLVGGERTVGRSVGGVSDGIEAAGDFNGDGLPDLAFLEFAIRRWNVVTMLDTGALLFSPNSPLSFAAAQLVGTASAPQSVILTNTGATPVWVRSIEARGQFQASNNCGKEIAVGGNCTVSVVFEPKGAGFQKGFVILRDSASSRPQVVEVSGRGTFVALSPNPLNFGPQKVGTTSSPQQLSITNNGSTSLAISSISLGGADAKDFAVSGTSNCTSGRLAAGATCSVTITFSPRKTGACGAIVFVDDNGAGSPETGALTGTGT
jgi:hypothetical protein